MRAREPLTHARLTALLAAALALSACSSPFVQPAPGPRTVPAPSEGRLPGEPQDGPSAQGEGPDIGREAPAPGPRSTAATALLAESRADRDSGDLGGAAATIERALAIAPDDALLWIELAEIRFEQGNAAAGQQMARKALTLTGDDTVLEARARRLVGR